MTAVDEYYNQREMVEQIDQRRVFLASDDPKVNTYQTSLYYENLFIFYFIFSGY